ncbi:MAG: SAM-dependent methyltransferase, partial [Opitutaceae bacterium]
RKPPAWLRAWRFFVAALERSTTLAGMFITCQAGFEALLARELVELNQLNVAEQGPGWVRSAEGNPTPATILFSGEPVTSSSKPIAPEHALSELTFAHLTFLDAVELHGDSVNVLAQRVADFFLTSLKGERVETVWPCVWSGPAEVVGLGRRISSVEAAFGELLKKKLSRVAKLAAFDLPRGVGAARGLFVFFTDFGRAFVAREAFTHGQRRMADDDLAPSRSYLKVEEAYIVLGREPVSDETVCDLGAAPGGWSYSAAKRGARVVAVDNGPLKGGALGHAAIEHLCEDAFKFAPRNGEAFDWLFCDLVEEPHHVVQHLIAPWLSRGWCRRFVVNFKFGRVDAIALLRELRAPDSPFSRYAPDARFRHLYHDREEFTVVGEILTNL